MTEDKYKLFRNYMANELAITRDDIERWTRESVADVVRKLAGQLNIEAIVMAEARKVVLGSSTSFSPAADLRQEVAKHLVSKLKMRIVTEP